jgi:hypothetical protein
MRNQFFKYLNYILKIDKKRPENLQYSQYMVNRWLSMTNKPIAQIVNSTTNRWNISDYNFLTNFLLKITPKYTKKIEYIKKSPKEAEETFENMDQICFSMEISKKELELYHNTLDELKLLPK